MSSSTDRSVTLTLDAAELQHPRDLTTLLRRRLSIPHISSLDQNALRTAIARRIILMANASRSVKVEISNANNLPSPVLDYLNDLSDNTPLELTLHKLINHQEQQQQTTETPAQKQTQIQSRQTNRFGRRALVVCIGLALVSITMLTFFPSSQPIKQKKVKSTPEEAHVKKIEKASQSQIERKVENQQLTQPSSTPTTSISVSNEAPKTKSEVKTPGSQPFRYSIQLASFRTAQRRDSFIERHQNFDTRLLIAALVDESGKTHHLAMYGQYEGYTLASSELKALPSDLKEAQPFVIDVKNVDISWNGNLVRNIATE